jgi:hypothetical protein
LVKEIEGGGFLSFGTFEGCSSLTTVYVSKKTKIAKGAFDGCPNVQIIRY